ncbi:MAG: hypothetical protein HY562_06415 [Ignavibacteriales bacterium]|nr:hypothetical protein [Ignavibacteriales bacterium]
MKKIVLFLALVAGLVAGYFDFISSEMLVPLLIIVGFTFIFGYLLPSIAWRLAVLAGIGVPLVIFTAYYLGYEPPFVEELKDQMPDFDYDISEAVESFIAFIPSFLGAYGGVLVKKIVSGAFKKATGIEPPST